MFTVIGLLLKSFITTLINVVTSIFTAVMTIVSRYPIQCACLAVLVLSNAGTWWWTKANTTAVVSAKYEAVVKELKTQVNNWEELEEARKLHIAEIEESSKAAAKKAEDELKVKNAEMEKASKDWATKLAAEIARRKIDKQVVYVTNPVTQDKVEVTLDKGEVVCGRLHDAVYEGINELVEIANRDMKSPPALIPPPVPTPKPVADIAFDDLWMVTKITPQEIVFH